MIQKNEYIDTLISVKRYEIMNEVKEVEKILVKKSSFSFNKIQIDFLYYDSNHNIDEYDNLVKLSFDNFKSNIANSISQFGKSVIKAIKMEIESGKEEKGYQVPSIQEINSKTKITSISVYINEASIVEYDCRVKVSKITSGSKSIDIIGTLKFKYDKTGNKLKTNNADNIHGFNVYYK